MKDYFLGIFKRNPQEIQGLNGIRGIAYFMVIYAHCYRPYKYFGFPDPNPYWENFLNNGSLSMDAFFVLSGFLIGGQLLSEWKKTGTIRYGSFLSKRVFRIFPPYYLFLSFQLLFFLHLSKTATDPLILESVPVMLDRIRWDYLYMSDYLPATMIHGWSLSVEEKFYLLLPFLLYFVGKLRSPKVLLWLFFGLFLLPIAFRTWQYSVAGYVDAGSYTSVFYYPFHSRMDSLFLGVFLAGVHLFYPDTIHGFLKKSWSSWVVLLAVCGLLGLMIFTNEDAPDAFTCIWRFTFTALAWSILLLKTLDPLSWTARFFSWRIFIPVAKLSYCAYILHLVILGALSKKFLGYQQVRYEEILLWTIPLGSMILFYAYFYYLVAERPFLYLRKVLLRT